MQPLSIRVVYINVKSNNYETIQAFILYPADWNVTL